VLVDVRHRVIDGAHQFGDHLGDHGRESWLVTLGMIDAEHITVLVSLFGQVVAALVASLAAIVAALSLSVALAVLLLVVVVFAAWAGARSDIRLMAESMRHYEATEAVTTMLGAVLDGRDTVAGLGIAAPLLDRARGECEAVAATGVRFARALARSEAVGRAVGSVAFVGLVVLIASSTGRSHWSVAQTVTAIALIGAVVPQTAMLSAGVGRIATARAAAVRLVTVLDPVSAVVPFAGLPPSPPAAPVSVTLEDVGVGTRDGEGSALRDVTLTIAPGALVVVCGPTGAGKSLLLQLVRGSVPPTSGRVRVGGLDPYAAAAVAGRPLVASAEQHPFLYDDTLSTNLALADASDAAVARALRVTAADGLPALLSDRTLGRRGRAVSGGQRRRIVAARALAAGAPVVVLDDPTGSLDPRTETRVAERLAAGVGSTVIVASNRRALAARADLVVLLDAGRLVDHGRHTELLARQSSYRDLIGTEMVDHRRGGER
jgi:ABC-type multidrug transport system fused ATPase/permease subunit